MKRSSRLFTVLTLVSPVIALPLINATHMTSQFLHANVEEETYHWGDHGNTYTVQFVTDPNHPDWGTFGVIHAFNMKESEEQWTVPDVVLHNGQEYKIRKLDLKDRATGDKRFRVLDLSKAYWLDEICDNCFDHKSDNTNKYHFRPNFYWVDFSGAFNLTRIGDHAFDGQEFNTDRWHDNDCLDLSNTRVKTIGKAAFKDCFHNADGCQRIDTIIFPTTLIKSGDYAFGGNYGSRRMYTTRDIFLNPDPPIDTLEADDSYPHASGWGQYIVPKGTYEKYKKLKNFTMFESEGYESHLEYTDISQDNLNLVGFTGKKGFNAKQWIPYDWKKQSYATDAIVSLNWNCNGKIKINNNCELEWSGDIKPGTYQFNIIARQYDDKEHKAMSAVVSPQITLTIVDSAKLTGGSRTLYSKVNTAGQDTKLWRPYVAGHQVLDAEYWINGDKTGKIKCAKDDNNNCLISWDAIPEAGTTTFLIKAKLQISDNTWVPCEQSVIMTVSDTDTEFSIDMYIDNATKKYTGKKEKITTQGLNFWADPKAKIGQTVYTTSTPQLSCELGSATIAKDGDKWKFVVPDDLPNGEYRFYVYCDVTNPGTTAATCIYSDLITVFKKDDLTEYDCFNPLPTEVYTGRETAGSATLNIIPSSSSKIVKEVNLTKSPFAPETHTGNVKAAKAANPKDIVISWDKEFITDPKPLYDINLQIKVVDPTTNEELALSTCLTLVTTNTASMKYDGPTTLYTYGDTSKTFDKEFIFKVNGIDPAETDDIVFYTDVDTTDPSKYENKIVATKIEGSNKAKLSCTGLSESEETLNGLTVNVRAYDTNTLTYAKQTVRLYAGNKLQMEQLPTDITITKGTAGKSDPFVTMFNGQTSLASDVTYKFEGLPDGKLSVKDNCLEWDGKTSKGYYEVKLTASKVWNEKTYTDTKWIKVNVVEKSSSKSNLGAIIGGSVGGAVAVGGGTTGTVLGVKKHKAKLLKTKK